MRRVRIQQGGVWDPDLIEQDLGQPPLDIPPLLAPVLTIDGHIEPDASAWLAYVAARTGGPYSTKTSASYAESLSQYVAFLVDRNTSLRGATNRHIVAYVNQRTVNDQTRVAGTTWSRDRTAIKQFYVWLRDTHRIQVPITLDNIRTPRGVVTSMREGRNVPKASAAGTPLEPPQIDELLGTAWIHGANRATTGSLTGARDAAFIALGVACGGRVDTLAHLTIYELPDQSRPGDLVEMYLPGATSKIRREVRLPAFRHHLQRVHDYANPDGGSRNALLKGWTPADPIHVAQLPTPTFRGIIDTTGTARLFNTMTASERRRLVTPSGEPAMLFISTRDGAPLQYATAQEITGDVSAMAETNAHKRGTFFPHVHSHDLRHTYATHLAALFFLGVATGAGRDMHGNPQRVDIRSAVQDPATAARLRCGSSRGMPARPQGDIDRSGRVSRPARHG
ncbi:site-specific integrase [Cryobacterium lyxosi]|uniref:site-specific integrase n=1 Tax=Cryobacterium lyxosi TaxID=1259228 RepID=UPI003B96A2B9